MPDLDNFLTVPESEASPEPAVETAPSEPMGVESAPPAPEPIPRDESGRFTKREPEQPVSQQGHAVPLEALLAERERRQAAERMAEELRSKAAEPVDVWADPQKFVETRVREAETRLLDEADKRAEQRARELFLSYTESAARGRYDDYDSMRAVFAEEVQKNPVLVTQLAAAPDPAEFIYRQGRTAAELREVGGDLSAYRKRVETQIRQQMEAEFAAKVAKLAAVPQSLNSEPSKGAGITGSTWNGPTPLEDILPNRRN